MPTPALDLKSFVTIEIDFNNVLNAKNNLLLVYLTTSGLDDFFILFGIDFIHFLLVVGTYYIGSLPLQY